MELEHHHAFFTKRSGSKTTLTNLYHKIPIPLPVCEQPKTTHELTAHKFRSSETVKSDRPSVDHHPVTERVTLAHGTSPPPLAYRMLSIDLKVQSIIFKTKRLTVGE